MISLRMPLDCHDVFNPVVYAFHTTVVGYGERLQRMYEQISGNNLGVIRIHISVGIRLDDSGQGFDERHGMCFGNMV